MKIHHIIPIGLLALANTSIAATWTDSLGQQVSDQSVVDRGTATGGLISNAIGVADILIMSDSTAQALSDLSHLADSDGGITASCSTPAITIHYTPCPEPNPYIDPNGVCRSKPIYGYMFVSFPDGFLSLNAPQVVDNNKHTITYNDFDSGTVVSNHVITDLYQVVDGVTPNVPLSRYGINLGGTQSYTYPSRQIRIRLDPTGYSIKVDNEPLTTNPAGDLSFFGNTRYSNLSNHGTEVLEDFIHYPMYTLPAFKWAANRNQQNNTVTYVPAAITQSDSRIPYSRTIAGVQSLLPYGGLVHNFSLASIEHLTSSGHFSNQIRMNIELAQVKRANNTLISYNEGYRTRHFVGYKYTPGFDPIFYTYEPLHYSDWELYSVGPYTTRPEYIYNYPGGVAPTAAESNYPFRVSNLICTFQ